MSNLVAAPLTSLDYRIAGTFLQVAPAALSVPKGIPGSVLVSVIAGGSTNDAAGEQLSAGAYVQAVIRGPGFPTPQRLVAPPNTPLMLPPINLVGDYQLDGIALVDAATGQTRMEGSPSSVPVHVFDQVLISSVTSRPLTLEEIQQKGIAIDDSNFRAVEFNVSFVLEGKTIPVSFPVVAPQFKESTELIPLAEVEERLKQAAVLNQVISSEVVQLPPELETAGLNIQVQGINFQVVDESGEQNLALTIPPIPALMVIPGNIGFLHQFFSVKLFTENGAPVGSGLSVDNIQAQLSLPSGQDGIVSTNYDKPGDDPLRFARLGPNKIVQPILPVVDPSADGQLGTADDVSRLQPSQTGQAEFLVEGLQEGLHVMNVDLTGNLHGLVAGVVRIKGKAAGSVLVRNPAFSITFSHPRTVRVGEPYAASITILNTGITPANLVQIALNRNSVSGAVLAAGQAETLELGTILPGRSATATYRMVSQRTGQVTFTDLTTGDNSVTGRFRFSMGVTAQGVPLSPDTIAMPDYVNNLPSNLVASANRVLGQALSIATAAQLPPGIARIGTGIITRRVLDLAEAGQRVQYGDPLPRVLTDLLRDWQGGRLAEGNFDALLRTSDAGLEWTSVLMAEMENADHLEGTQRLLERAPDLAGLGQQFVIASAGAGQLRVDFSGETNSATIAGSTQPHSLVYAATNSVWAVVPHLTNALFTWTFTNAPAAADMAMLLVSTNGQALRVRWQVSHPPVTARYQFALADQVQQLLVDTNGDDTVDVQLTPDATVVNELPPAIVAVQQDLSVLAGRPQNACGGPSHRNYGTVVAVVFSKPMTRDSAGAANSYTVGGNNGANSVQVQPSGRVALLNLRNGISAIRPRDLSITGVTDVRGNLLVASPTLIRSYFPGTTNPFTGGVALRGRVLRGDGTAAAGVPVTLTMYDETQGFFGCESWIRRVSQVLTDAGGNFDLDFVMSGIPYSVSASDTYGMSSNALQLIMQTTVTDSPDVQKLKQLVAASATPNNLLGLLSAGTLPQAVAIVEGLDRAVLRDFVNLGSGREGQEVPIALRFRGRATVLGQVVSVDGLTPVPDAAVNLFPDPSSRELGRGVFADGNGQFAFAGVPLGVFSVQVETSDRRSASVLGIVNMPGQTTNVVIALPTNIVVYADLRGQVFDADNITPVPNARVFLGQASGNTVREIIRILDADASGVWQATNVPIQRLDVVAVTFDGKRKGVRTGITPVGNQTTFVNVTLQAATTVSGLVQFDNGWPATNALVAGGVALVRTDESGRFQLEGVPVGSSTISAGLERNPAAGIDFPRLGSTSASIVAGEANYVVVTLRPAGRVFGKVFDARGNLQPGVRVAIPQVGGFYWTDADTNGNYVFENLGLGNYTVSAPANAVSPQINEDKMRQQLSSGNEDEILAAFSEAVRVFVGADDPLITGEHGTFRPSKWGYTSASLRFDGANVNADIHYIVQGSVSGRILNPQGVPIGATVLLTGLGPSMTGNPIMTERGRMNSDPATGEFNFENVLLAGPWGLQAASPFYPVVLQTNGFTTPISPDAKGITLQFPPIQEVNGRIAGHVFMPDGTPAGDGVRVHINISGDYQILTDTNGFFDTQTAFPALGRSYVVEAFDPASGLKGRAGIGMTPGITNFVDVHLLSRDSTLQVVVLRANGQPAAGAPIQLDHGSYPHESPVFAIADTNGVATFAGLWEGNYSVTAQFTEASTTLFARGGSSVGPNESRSITLRMGATGSIVGTFLKQDLVTPVYGAAVTIGNLGFASTDTNGFFRFDGVPIGSYQISGSDPVSGANAVASAAISFNGQIQTVQLVEGALGDINGFVLDPYGTGYVPGARVHVNFSDGFTPSRVVTTGPNGAFDFLGSPMGDFSINASYDLPGALNMTVSGQASGRLSASAPSVSVNIQLQPLGYVPVHVVRADGLTPATNVTVTLGSGGRAIELDTSASGDVLFTNLPVPATYGLRAVSRISGESHNGVSTVVTLTGRGTNPPVTLVLPGVGTVVGTVVGSDGLTPVWNADVALQVQSPLFSGTKLSALTDIQGRFVLDDVPIGSFLVTASSLSLAASAASSISVGGQTNEVTLRLGNSGSILGQVVRADGTTPVGGEDVLIEFASQSQNAGHVVYRTSADGQFRFDNVPVGAVHVSSAAPDFGGIISFNTVLSSNGQILNLGQIPYDEALPAVVQVTPRDTAIDVPITNAVELVFSEALAADSINPSGIFIRGTNGNVPSTVNLLPDTNGSLRRVRIQPVAPLQSKKVYTVIVLSGDLPGATGGLLGSGPRDLVGRIMAGPFESHFATADNTPPLLLSLFPSNNAVQIDPSAAPRLTFDKTLRPTGFVFVVTGPGGVVPGAAGVGINGQVLSFVPTANLRPNETYSLLVSNVLDLAGNRAADEPFTSTFTTVDTIGPTIATLRIASNVPPTAGAVVPVEAVLATNEPGASVRFTQDFTPVGTATSTPYVVLTRLSTSSNATIRAIATDQYGNDGPFAQLEVAVQPPQPPTLQFTLISPTNLPIPSGSSVIVDVAAAADTGISNFTAVMRGAATGLLVTTNGTQLRVEGLVPTNAIAGQDVQVFAQVTDDLGFSSGEQVLRLPTRDAAPPVLTILGPTNDAVLEPDESLSLAVAASENSSNVTVLLTITGSVTATQTVALVLTPNVPATNVFAVPLTNGVPLGGPFTARLTATDASGNSVSVTRTFRLRGPPPVIQFARVTPASGPVSSGSPLVVDVHASGGNGIAQLTARMTGGATAGPVTNSGSSLRLQATIPATNLAGGEVQILAEALDALGQSSGLQTLTVPVSDGTAPAVAVSGPTNGTVFLIGQELGLSTVVSDNSSNVTLGLSVSGSVTATQMLALTLAPNEPVTNVFNLQLTNGSALGGPFTATFTVADAATNVTVATRTYRLRGPGPTLEFVRVSPTNGPAPSSRPLVVDVVASSANGIGQITARMTGAATVGPLTNAGPVLRLQGTVAAASLAGSSVQIVAEARDTIGQSSADRVTLEVSDGTAPILTVLGLTNGTLFSIGDLLDQTVIASDNSSNVTLGLSLFGSVTATQSVAITLTPNVPLTNFFSVALTNVSTLGGPFTALCTATDTDGNSVMTIRNFRLKGPAPTLQFTRVTPVSGPVPSGSSVAVNVTATSGNGIAQLVASLGGAVNVGPITNPTPSLLVQGFVPATAVAGEKVQVLAGAVDTLGQSSGQQRFELLISDATAPALAVLSPPDNTDLPANQPLDLPVAVSDNSSNVSLALSISGGVTATQTVVVPLLPNTPVTNLFTIPLSNMVAGSGLIAATVSGTDAAGNNTTTTRRYWITPSQTTAVTWNRQALGQTFTCTNGSKYSWPSNNNWSQSAQFGDPCQEGTNVVTAPSNWSTTNYPNGPAVDVVLGGIGGAPANLDVTVSLNSLTIQSNGGLTLRYGTKLTAAQIDLQGDGTLGTTGQGQYIGEPAVTLGYGGTLMKYGGAGVFAMDPIVRLTCVGGTIGANAGTLALPGSGCIYSNDTFTAAAGAALDLVPANNSVYFYGTFGGSGGGQVQLNQGMFIGGPATLNFPSDMFQWVGGRMQRLVTNIGTITLTSTNNHQVWEYTTGPDSTEFVNAGRVQHDAGTLDVPSRFANFRNLASGVYDFTGEGDIICSRSGSLGYGVFHNEGLLRKSGGSNSVVSAPFNNLGGTIEVLSGTLALSAEGGVSSNGTIIVAAGAVADITGGSSPTSNGQTWRGRLAGSGAGQVQMNNGLIWGDGLMLDFPDGMFQWTGGRLAGRAVTNAGVMTLSGTNAPSLWSAFGLGAPGGCGYTNFYNLGMVRQFAGTLDLKDGPVFYNRASGTYEIHGDGNLSYSGGCAGLFHNEGLLRKRSGTNSIFAPTLKNLGGTIQVDAGTLALRMYGDAYSEFNQGGGTLSFALGGRNEGQWGQITCTGGVTLGGALNAFLANGFAPAPGDEFRIVSGYWVKGAFNSVTLPFGGTLRFTNDAVYVVFTGQTNLPPAVQFTQITPTNGPVASGSSFAVDVSASDDDGVAQILATVSGVVTNAFTNSGGSLRVTGSVPPTVLAGQTVQIVAQARSFSGQTTIQGFSLPVSDGTMPAVAITDPPRNTRLPLDRPLLLTALASDNSANVTLHLSTFGSLALTQTVAVPLVPNTPTSKVFTVPLDLADPAGGKFTAVLVAIDLAGNGSTNRVDLWLPPAATITAIWNRQALGQTLHCTNGAGSYTWPNNYNWSQSAQFGDPCGYGVNVMTVPSNWSITNYPNGTMYDAILSGLGGSLARLDVSVALNSLIVEAGGGLYLPADRGTSLAAADFDFRGDGSITRGSCCSVNTLILNAGTMRKSAGTNTFTIQSEIVLNSLAGTFAVDSGTLALPGANSSYTDGAFEVASNATLILVPSGGNAYFGGSFTGSGEGRVLLNAGSLRAGSGGVTFNLPAPLFQWTGGRLVGTGFTNAGTVQLAGGVDVFLSGTLANAGLMRHSGAGGLGFDRGTASRFLNLVTGTYRLESGGRFFVDSCCSPIGFDNYGLFLKSGSPSNAVISVPFGNRGGVVEVETGTLTLANDGSSYSGTFIVASNAALDVSGGASPTWAGEMGGWGDGAVVLASGTVNASPSVSLNFSDGLFQWKGGLLAGTATNLNVLMLLGDSDRQLSGRLYNAGVIRHMGRGRLGFDRGPASTLRNLAGGVYELENDGGFIDYSCCSDTVFVNSGLVRKSGGTNESRFTDVRFNNQGGEIEVQTGRLTLANSGSSSNGTVTVAAGARLDLTGGYSPGWAGYLRGTGAGRIELNSGTLSGSGLILDCDSGVFHWTGGNLGGSTINTNVLAISGDDDVYLQGTVANAGLVRHSGTGRLGLDRGPASRFDNLATGTYQLESAAGVFPYSCCSAVAFNNYGVFAKIGSLGNAVITAPFNNLSGVVSVQNGTLTLANGGSSLNGTFTVAAGATLDITGGQDPTWAGLMNGQGEGAVTLRNGTLRAAPGVALNFADGLFQWNGGTVSGLVTNLNTVLLTGSGDRVLSGQLNNAGLVRHTGQGRLQFDRGPSATLRNLPGGTYQFEADCSFSDVSCCGAVRWENRGLVRKIGGTNITTIGVPFNSLSGTVEVNTGRLSLANDGSSVDGAFIIAAGASVDLTGGQSPTWAGRMVGTGAGQLELTSGRLNAAGLTLDCAPGLLQWSGGVLAGLATNLNTLLLTGTGDHDLSGELNNAGLVRHMGSGRLRFDRGPSATLRNLPGGTYQIETDCSFPDYSCCSAVRWENRGLVRKIGGTSTATISVPFDNLGGTVEVTAGRLTLGNDGSSSNGTFMITAGASVNLTGGQTPTWAGRLVGTGDGRLELPSGRVNGVGLILDCAPGLFQWNGGAMGGTVTNVNEVTVTGGRVSGNFFNAGLVRHSGPDPLDLDRGPTAQFHNLPGGEYRFETGVNIRDVGCCSSVAFNNRGLVRKSGGTNTSTISVPFNNQNGSIEVDSGTLAIASYAQGSGVLTVLLGGTNAGQSGRLNVSGSAALSGPFNVFLATGYVPPLGSQFQILSCGSRSGVFSSVGMPDGISINYSNNGVFLVVTGAVALTPPIIVSQPSNVTNVIGGSAAFRITASGVAPLGYQWRFNGAVLGEEARHSGSKSPILRVSSLSAADAGNYQVVVTNPLGSVTSRVASLMLQSCPQSAGLLAWWPGDGDFQDRINGFDGVSAGTVTFAPAEVGQGFHLVNSAISASGGFDFSAANALTIELWFKLNALKNYNGLVSAQNCCSYRLMVDPGRHLFYDPGTHTDTSVGPVLNLGQFYHVALVIVGGGSASLYLDGQVIHASSNGVPAALPPVSTFLLGAGENSGTWTMEDGIIDEISIYGRPLSAAEVAALHAAGRSGKCAVELPAPVAVIGETVNGTLQILSPVVTDGRFSFSFQSSDGRSYIVEQKDDLSTSGWTLYTNLAGNGSLIEVNAPLTNVPQRYFRVRAP